MATKYSEVTLAVHFRERDADGEYSGGPMYAIKNGLGKNWSWLATLFALCGGVAGFGIANGVQANAMAGVLASSFAIPPWLSGLVLMTLTGLIICGGIKRIGRVAQALVPAMCIGYLLCAGAVLAVNVSAIPAAFALIFEHAFTPVAAAGGFAGAAAWAALQFGVARGVFSSEAGLGTAGIAQAAGAGNNAVQAGLIGMLGVFFDTLVICTFTGLAIITSNAWTSGASGALLATAAFDSALPGAGRYMIAVALVLFAFTTILGWAYYAEKCWQYLFGVQAKWPFRLLWILAIPLSISAGLDVVWLVSDTLGIFLTIPNLIALILLSPVLLRLTREYFTDGAATPKQPATTARSAGV
jgi:AGCS family alanine or glycine:cation symporter